MEDVWKEIGAFTEKWDAFFDQLDCFKNPKPMAWQFHPWGSYNDHSDFWKNYDRA
jgi:hypothetical protein